MAAKNTFNYNALIKELNTNGALGVYLLWGDEDYLREQFTAKLRSVCLPDGGNDFCYRRFDAEQLNMDELADAVNAMPFMSERSFIEIRGFDPAAVKDREMAALEAIISDIPDYCTIVFITYPGKKPDMRLRLCKNIKKIGSVIEFAPQDEYKLTDWIIRRFAALGKSVSASTANRLILNSGDLMSGLIGEIEKIAAGTKAELVTDSDVDRLGSKITSAKVFDMTNRISAGDFSAALAILNDLITSGDEPIMILAVIGMHMRDLYAARLTIDENLGRDYLIKICGKPWLANPLLSSAKNFSLDSLSRCVQLCTEHDYLLKSSGGDSRDILLDLLINIYYYTVGGGDDENW
ncbi:MAG: DNA polymerase III subunit delta [Ruminococcaceae bacterium]|nr:DNA polymerase III subunit delta [Oscillospiraceae bacterium]